MTVEPHRSNIIKRKPYKYPEIVLLPMETVIPDKTGGGIRKYYIDE